MDTDNLARGTSQKTDFEQSAYLAEWVEAFLIDRKVQNLSPGTLDFYRKKLSLFCGYCESQVISQVTQITPNDLRVFLIWLEEQGHNPGGIHAVYRAVKAFLRWYELEAEPENWKNPIRRVKAPKLSEEPLDPADLDTIRAMVKTCAAGGMLDKRDKAALLALLDTGARAAEFLALDLADVNPVSGAVLIRFGKGRKRRTVYLGKNARKALRAYLTVRQADEPALWVTDDGNRLAYGGLRAMLERRAITAGVETPEPHSFRRAFSLECLRGGMDIFTLRDLMGHADLKVLQRYLKLIDDDRQAAHAKASPADRL
jgi:integrase/recombinase XerD